MIERVGGREEIPIDVRIVCATHQDLKALIKEGRFREDLYYRLAEIVVEHSAAARTPGRRGAAGARVRPALRGRAASRIDDAALRCGRGDRSAAVARQRARTGKLHAPRRHHGRRQSDHGRRRRLRGDCRRRSLRRSTCARFGTKPRSAPSSRCSVASNGNVVKAAEMLGVSRPTLYDVMRRFGLK